VSDGSLINYCHVWYMLGVPALSQGYLIQLTDGHESVYDIVLLENSPTLWT